MDFASKICSRGKPINFLITANSGAMLTAIWTDKREEKRKAYQHIFRSEKSHLHSSAKELEVWNLDLCSLNLLRFICSLGSYKHGLGVGELS